MPYETHPLEYKTWILKFSYLIRFGDIVSPDSVDPLC